MDEVMGCILVEERLFFSEDIDINGQGYKILIYFLWIEILSICIYVQ